MKRLYLLPVAAAAWCMAGDAKAQGEGFYFAVGGGWSSLDPVKLNVGATVGPIAGKSSFADDAAVNFSGGYKFRIPVRLEAEVKYTDFDAKRLALSPLPATALATGDLGVTSFFANALYDYPLSRRVALTFGGGLGAALADANLADRIKDQIVHTGAGFSWQGIAGFTVALSSRFQAQLDYRYQAVDDTGHAFISLPGTGDASLRSKRIQAAMLTLRWFVDMPEAPRAPVAAPLLPGFPPPQPPAPAVPLVKSYVVYFDVDRSDLTPEAREVVANAAATANTEGAVRVVVAGHPDAVGSTSCNLHLLERRAEAVKSQLVADGVPAEEIATVGKGLRGPLVSKGSDVREPQNRRAVIDLGQGPTS